MLDYNSSYMFRYNCRAIFRQIFEKVKFTIDNALNLRDLILQELVKVIVVCYIKDLRQKFKCGTYTISIKIDKVKLTKWLWGYTVDGIWLK
jgi:hypothetical protein